VFSVGAAGRNAVNMWENSMRKFSTILASVAALGATSVAMAQTTTTTGGLSGLLSGGLVGTLVGLFALIFLFRFFRN